MFRGSFTALVTPFRDGALDRAALDTLLERQVAAGTHGIAVCGTTGESPTISADEHLYIVERAVAVVKGRIPVMVGTGANATAKAVDMTHAALKAGADAALIVTPYYNRPTQDGLYAHYRTIAEAVPIPVVIYNIPGRCGVDLKTETLARLAKLSNIVAVKDATGDLRRPAEVVAMLGPDFCQLSGDDPTTLEFLAAGGHGSISVTANVTPELCATLQTEWQNGNRAAAQEIQNQLMPLHKALFVETSPSPVKYALSALGLCMDEMRLPLLPASAAARRVVDTALSVLDLTSLQSDKSTLRSHG